MDMKDRKKRVFVFVEERETRKGPSLITAVSGEGQFFRLEVDDKADDYAELFEPAIPAERAFAQFEAFCKEECGLKDPNDEVIFSDDPDPRGEKGLFAYIAHFLGAADWAVVKFIAFEYRYETTHLSSPLPFSAFKKESGGGLPEPYATKRLYEEYRRLIHKDSYSPEEICRMEEYATSHLYLVYRRKSNFGASVRIARICAEIYKCDRARAVRLIDLIVEDFKGRRVRKKRSMLQWLLFFITDYVLCEGYIDYADADDEKPLMERKENAIFKTLRPDHLQIVADILESSEA